MDRRILEGFQQSQEPIRLITYFAKFERRINIIAIFESW